MTVTEIKEELHKVIETMPEEALKDVLGLVNQIQKSQVIDDRTIDAHLDAIVSENKGLLEKLAQ